MALFKPPEPLVVSENVSHEWTMFKEQFLLFLRATEADSKSDEIKVAQLLNVIGREALSIFRTFKLGDIDKLKLTDVLEAFDKHFNPARMLCTNGSYFLNGYKRSVSPSFIFSQT